MAKINARTVSAELRRLASEFPDRVNEICQYVVDGEPHCVVGVVNDRLGVPNPREYTPDNDESVRQVQSFQAFYDTDAIELLDNVQTAADFGYARGDGAAERTWADSIEGTLRARGL